MSTLYVRDVPEDLYERLRARARDSRRSVSAETIEPSRQALEPRRGVSLDELLRHADELRSRTKPRPGAPSAAELIRADRER